MITFQNNQRRIEQMKTFFRWVLMVGIVFQFLSSPAYAWWKAKVAVNERMAAEYIARLKDGADPGSVERPAMRFISQYQAKQEQKKFIKAMDEAEEFARAGKHDQIQELESEYRELEFEDI
jgi:hypothetical protein